MDHLRDDRDLLATLTSIRNMDAGAALTLPPAFYTSEDFFALERAHIFEKEWLCLGRAEEVPNPGDYFATEMLGEPLIVVRGEDGGIRVLSNVCRHRASTIVEGRGNARHFVCPYHAWTYGIDGRLATAPYMDRVAGFDVDRHPLPELASATWQGFVFVNLDGKAPPLAPRLAALDDLLRNQHPAEMTSQWTRAYPCDANWKCVAENALEAYHLSVLHRTTLHSSTPTRLAEKLPCGDAYTAYRSHYDPNFQPDLPVHPDVTEAEKRFSVLFFVYPTLLVSVAARRISYLCLDPHAADRVTVRQGLATFARDLSADAMPPTVDARRFFQADDPVFQEDLEQMGRLGRGLKSRYVTPSPLGPDALEGAVWDIFQYVARRVVPGGAPRPRRRRAP
jgi:choline monooxygenase